MSKLVKGMLMIPNIYNPMRAWVIRRYACGHYHVNQIACGRLVYGHWVRVVVPDLAAALDMSVKELESRWDPSNSPYQGLIKQPWFEIPFYSMLHPTDWDEVLFKVSAWQAMDNKCKLIDVRGQAEQFVVHEHAQVMR